MPFCERPDAKIYYEVHGQGSPIILAHGVGGNHASWFHQINVLAQNYMVIAFDHRGFGNSTDPDNVGRSAFVDDLAALVDHLNLDKVSLVAQSMGGGTCLGFTCRYPGRVRALVLADTLVGFKLPEEITGRMAEVSKATESLSQIQRVLGPRICEERPDQALLYTQLASFNSVNRTTLQGSLEQFSPEDLAATKVPTMFVVGLDDVLFPPDAVRVVQQHTPGSLLVEIAGAGHSAYYESPVEFNDSVLSFLQAMGIKGEGRLKHSNAPGYVPVN